MNWFSSDWLLICSKSQPVHNSAEAAFWFNSISETFQKVEIDIYIFGRYEFEM